FEMVTPDHFKPQDFQQMLAEMVTSLPCKVAKAQESWAKSQKCKSRGEGSTKGVQKSPAALQLHCGTGPEGSSECLLFSTRAARTIDADARIVLVHGVQDLIEQVEALFLCQVGELVLKKRKHPVKLLRALAGLELCLRLLVFPASHIAALLVVVSRVA